jgi:phosphoserine phosphatase
MAIKVVFLDCDGTLTKVKSSWEYLHRRLGLWDGNADSYQELFRQGAIDYHEFCRRDALLWAGLPVADAMKLIGEIPYQSGAGALVEGLRQRGIFTVIVSTGLSLLADKVGQDLGIDEVFSNDLLSEGGRLTGNIRVHVDYDGKGALVRRVLADRQVLAGEACALGDGEGDIGMFEEVGLPIGFRPAESVVPHVRCSLMNGNLAEALPIIGDHKGGS